MTISTMNLCSLVSVYIFLWGIVMDKLREGYNAVITEWGWQAMLCNETTEERILSVFVCNTFSLWKKKTHQSVLVL